MNNKDELINLLVKIYEYMESRSDADIEGPNEEMSLMSEVDDMLHYLGVDGFGSVGRMSADSDYSTRKIEVNEGIKKMRETFKRFK